MGINNYSIMINNTVSKMFGTKQTNWAIPCKTDYNKLSSNLKLNKIVRMILNSKISRRRCNNQITKMPILVKKLIQTELLLISKQTRKSKTNWS